MTHAAKTQVLGIHPAAAASLRPAKTARYTRELLESLRKIATRQNQEVLAHLLELVRYEAQPLAGAPKTRTPDSSDAGHSDPPVPAPAEP